LILFKSITLYSLSLSDRDNQLLQNINKQKDEFAFYASLRNFAFISKTYYSCCRGQCQ